VVIHGYYTTASSPIQWHVRSILHSNMRGL
jgi:hypothetical protein